MRIKKNYDQERRQAALGRFTPVEFETTMATPVAVSAGLKLSLKVGIRIKSQLPWTGS